MLPTSLLVLTASLAAPMMAAAAPPSCAAAADATGYAAQKLPYLYNDFCSQLTAAQFGSKEKLYDSPIIKLAFRADSPGDCSLATCLVNFKSLVESCKSRPRPRTREQHRSPALPPPPGDRDDDQSLWGSGSIAARCGTFSFEVWAPDARPAVGTPRATLQAATMKTYDVATMTATTSARPHATYVAAGPSGAPSSRPTGAANATLLSPPSSGYGYGTGGRIAPASTPAPQGTSGGSALRVGGLGLVAVACVFAVFL